MLFFIFMFFNFSIKFVTFPTVVISLIGNIVCFGLTQPGIHQFFFHNFMFQQRQIMRFGCSANQPLPRLCHCKVWRKISRFRASQVVFIQEAACKFAASLSGSVIRAPVICFSIAEFCFFASAVAFDAALRPKSATCLRKLSCCKPVSVRKSFSCARAWRSFTALSAVSCPAASKLRYSRIALRILRSKARCIWLASWRV